MGVYLPPIPLSLQKIGKKQFQFYSYRKPESNIKSEYLKYLKMLCVEKRSFVKFCF